MGNITISSGISTIGNTTNADISLTGIDANVKSVKTMENGQWKSWTAGAPAEFQGFNKLAKGKGFVVNVVANANIITEDSVVDINDIPINQGLNFICFPFDNRVIGGGYLPRAKVTSMKTINNVWKSWSASAPDAFQGFLSIDSNKGYVINVEKTFQTYLNSNTRDKNNGVKIGSSYINGDGNTNGSNMVLFTPDAKFDSIDYIPVPYDATKPLIDMWINVGGTIKLIKFPQELLGKTFNIKEKAYNVIDYGSITQQTVTTDDYGTITQQATTVNDYGNLSGGTIFSNKVYTATFANIAGNSESNPALISNSLELADIEIMYDVLSVPSNPVYQKMLLDIAGVKAVLEFASVYVGTPFVLFKSGILYHGTFTVSESNYVILQ